MIAEAKGDRTRDKRGDIRDAHIDRLLDDALAGTFPASDPVSTLVPDQSPRSPPTAPKISVTP